MTAHATSIEEEIRRLEFDTASAQKWAGEGKIEAWVHQYLLAGKWANSGLSEGLKREQRWWRGPLEVPLTDLFPAVGVEPGMEYVVDQDYWQALTSQLAASFSTPLSLPPLIAEYRAGVLSLRDGNTRYGAMRLLGWPECWVIVWYNSERDYHAHQNLLR